MRLSGPLCPWAPRKVKRNVRKRTCRGLTFVRLCFALVVPWLLGWQHGEFVVNSAFSVTFWGARGSVPVSSSDTVIYGGNTPCVEVRAGDQVFMLDAGTGAVALGRKLVAEGTREITLLFSHLHHDHTAGLPFFAPVYKPETEMTIYCGNLGGETAQKQLDRLFGPPFFPLVFSKLPAKIRHEGFMPGDSFRFGDLTISTHPLNHPGGCAAYRFERGGKVITYATDVEHLADAPDPDMARFVEGSNLLIYDTMMADGDISRCKGWGHSTWRAGVHLCRAAHVGTLAAFHHNPDYDDRRIAELEAKLQAEMPGSFFCREGQTIAI